MKLQCEARQNAQGALGSQRVKPITRQGLRRDGCYCVPTSEYPRGTRHVEVEKDLEVIQQDVKTGHFHADVEEDMFVELTLGVRDREQRAVSARN